MWTCFLACSAFQGHPRFLAHGPLLHLKARNSGLCTHTASLDLFCFLLPPWRTLVIILVPPKWSRTVYFEVSKWLATLIPPATLIYFCYLIVYSQVLGITMWTSLWHHYSINHISNFTFKVSSSCLRLQVAFHPTVFTTPRVKVSNTSLLCSSPSCHYFAQLQ